MKKVLIVSYFYPPCNLPASLRPHAWARFLSSYGYKPVIVTRRWDYNSKSIEDLFRETDDKTKHEVFATHEVFYLPYKSNLRDKLLVNFGKDRFPIFRKALSFIELLTQNFFYGSKIYIDMERFILDYIKKDKDVKYLIITGNPFITFKIGYLSQIKSGLKWIADYRDAWTTSEINYVSTNILTRLLRVLDRYFEKKWISTASYVTASSLPIANQVKELTGCEGSELYNGFVLSDFENVLVRKYDYFTITYVGTLYTIQKVEIFCSAVKKLIDENENIKIRILFPGLLFYPGQADKVFKELAGYEKYFECTQRQERSKILEIEKASHLLLHVAWDEHAGIIASKIYEYLASGTRILVVPSDKGSIEEIIVKSKCGVCTNTIEETFDFLKKEYDNYLNGKNEKNDVTSPEVQQFSRENQVKKLAGILDNL